MHSWRFLLPLGLLTAVSASARGQNIIEMPGRTIEVVGLERWTIPMIQDSLAMHAPGVSLHHGGCAAVLRHTLGFADAGVTSYIGMNGPTDTTEYVVVRVVEPHDSARVRYRDMPLDTLGSRPEWNGAIELFRTRPGVFHLSLAHYLRTGERVFADPLPAPLQRDSVAVRQFLAFLAERQEDGDQLTAFSVLARDPNYLNRVVAAAILSNFGGDDATWLTLLEAMRESEGPVKNVASSVLRTFARTEPRTVDWQHSVPAIHAMLNGTSLFQFDETMEVLSASGLGPHWSRPFLANGGEAVLAHLAAEMPMLRHSAHRFLTTVSGQDFGYDVQRWREWIATL